MAVGQENQVVQAGAAAQPLATSAADVVTPDAVGQLTDAFRKGFVTADDVVQRIGDVGQAQKKALLESLGEYVSPQAINSRMAAYGASAAQSNLATQQASAAQGLIQPLTSKEQEDIQQARAERLSKNAVDAWTQWNLPIYKKDADGNDTSELDYDAMAKGGVQYVRAQNALAFSSHMLQGTWVDVKDPKTGQPRRVYVNSNGEDVTPVPGNKAFEFYNQMRRDAWSTFHGEPTQPQGSAPVAPSMPAAAAPADTSAVQPASASAPAAPAPDVVAPAYTPMTGIAAGPGNTVWTEKEIADELEKNKIYDNWAQTRTQVGNFISAAKAINAIKPEDQQYTNLNPQDLALAESLIKMYDPQGVIREFKWDKFEQNQPLLEKLKSLQQVALGTGKFAPSVRQDLIRLGQETIQAREAEVKPVLQQAVDRAKSNPTNELQNILDSKDIALLNGQSYASDVGSPATQPGSTPATKTVVVNGKKVYRGVDGKFYLAQ